MTRLNRSGARTGPAVRGDAIITTNGFVMMRSPQSAPAIDCLARESETRTKRPTRAARPGRPAAPVSRLRARAAELQVSRRPGARRLCGNQIYGAFVLNRRVHPTHWLISTQLAAEVYGRRRHRETSADEDHARPQKDQRGDDPAWESRRWRWSGSRTPAADHSGFLPHMRKPQKM